MLRRGRAWCGTAPPTQLKCHSPTHAELVTCNHTIEQDHRGIKQRYYPMRGFGNFDAAARFCRAFDEQRQYFRLRTDMRQRVPPLVGQRREFRIRLAELMSNIMTA